MWTFSADPSIKESRHHHHSHHTLSGKRPSLCVITSAIINQGKIVEQGRVSELLGRASAETFVLDVSTPITGALTIPDYRVSVLSDQQLEIEVARGQGLNALFESLSAANVQVDSLRNKTNRLEGFFIRLVKEKP